ncbi:MAG: VOC family protein [bacterium]|nr:VOC family protein [bacterium]
MFRKVHHIGVAVNNMEDALALYEKAGGRLIGRETSRDGKADLAMVDIGGSLIEPIAPLDDDSSVGKFIQTRGEGLHHIAFAVSDIKAELARLKKEGFDLIDESARPGFMGHMIAFIRPKSTMGALWELVEGEE